MTHGSPSRDGRPGLATRASRLLDRLRARPVLWDLSRYERALDGIDRTAAELGLDRLDDGALARRAISLAERARGGAARGDLSSEAFALAREAAGRALGTRPFDVQMIAGLALDDGRVIEMPTGEGKTLAAVPPAFLSAIYGRGVHVLTFNDYLAERDCRWMGPAYRMLGISVGFAVQGSSREERRRAYRSDVTYVTAREVGYDVLGEGLATDAGQLVTRPFDLAIVDEADSIMIDEARVPLVVAGSDCGEASPGRAELAVIARGLEEGLHFEVDEHRRNASLTDEGLSRVQALIGRGDLHREENRAIAAELNQALHARALLGRDVDYIVRGGRVEIVDELTGRVVRDRHWPDGLHRAVEAKEGLRLERDGRVLGSITVQHLLALYPRLCGMTGTALPSEREIERVYGLETAVIPPNRPCVREDLPDLLFTHAEAKRRAIVDEVERAHRSGRPVLIGTASVEESEEIARMLRAAGVGCEVLSAANDAREAEIVAEAGALGAVTVSTNMAGRGTDIRLGGADERDRDRVIALGGLYVVGACRFESRRIDDQLRGRAGRQGDPGASRFMISLEDGVMARSDTARWIPARYRRERLDGPIDDPVAHERIALAQRVAEGEMGDIRRSLWTYSSFVEKQRLRTRERRAAVLDGSGIDGVAGLAPERCADLAGRMREGALDEALGRIALFHIDRCWADHLAEVADIREGIYLERLGGRDPLHEFLKRASDAFERMEERVDRGIRETLEAVEPVDGRIDLDREGIAGPSSTWTYTVKDDPFEWVAGISSPGNIGLGIAAGLWGGLFVIREIARRAAGRRDTRRG